MSEIQIIYIVSGLQIILAFGLINVWLVRFNRSTAYRGKGTGNMEEEFHAYGLPKWFMYLIGVVKLMIAIALIAGLWMPLLVYPTVLVLGALMLGAISMHIKVRDSLMRTLPAMVMLTTAVVIIVLI